MTERVCECNKSDKIHTLHFIISLVVLIELIKCLLHIQHSVYSFSNNSKEAQSKNKDIQLECLETFSVDYCWS